MWKAAIFKQPMLLEDQYSFFSLVFSKVTAVDMYKLHISKVCGQSSLHPPTFFTLNLERQREREMEIERDKGANWKNVDMYLKHKTKAVLYTCYRLSTKKASGLHNSDLLKPFWAFKSRFLKRKYSTDLSNIQGARRKHLERQGLLNK